MQDEGPMTGGGGTMIKCRDTLTEDIEHKMHTHVKCNGTISTLGLQRICKSPKRGGGGGGGYS